MARSTSPRPQVPDGAHNRSHRAREDHEDAPTDALGSPGPTIRRITQFSAGCKHGGDGSHGATEISRRCCRPLTGSRIERGTASLYPCRAMRDHRRGSRSVRLRFFVPCNSPFCCLAPVALRHCGLSLANASHEPCFQGTGAQCRLLVATVAFQPGLFVRFDTAHVRRRTPFPGLAPLSACEHSARPAARAGAPVAL